MIHFGNENATAFEDALRVAQQKTRKLIEKHPDFYPMYTHERASGSTKGPPGRIGATASCPA